MFKLIPSLISKPLTVKAPLFSMAMVAIPFLAVPPVLATEYECRSDQEIRHIRVDYPGFDHLCEVSINKEGGSRDVKWYADAASSFCSDKIVDLVKKHEDLWGFSCEQWPDYDGIDELSPRQRKFLDELVKSSRTTERDDAQTNGDAEKSADLLAVQLFMGRVPSTSATANDDSASPALAAALAKKTPPMSNRVLLIRDDGKSYDTLVTQDNLNELIEINKAGYTLDSAMIDQIHPNGEVDVTTLVTAPDDDASAPKSEIWFSPAISLAR